MVKYLHPDIGAVVHSIVPRNKRLKHLFKIQLVGGFNPFQKYQSNWESSPNRGENKKYLSCHHPAYLRFTIPVFAAVTSMSLRLRVVETSKHSSILLKIHGRVLQSLRKFELAPFDGCVMQILVNIVPFADVPFAWCQIASWPSLP